MNKFLLTALAAAMIGSALVAPAVAGDVGISISVGEPGFYGRLDIGNFPHPELRRSTCGYPLDMKSTGASTVTTTMRADSPFTSFGIVGMSRPTRPTIASMGMVTGGTNTAGSTIECAEDRRHPAGGGRRYSACLRWLQLHQRNPPG